MKSKWECKRADCSASHLRVDDLVPAQRARLPKPFPAHLADEGPGPGVHRHVSGQVVMCVKDLNDAKTNRNDCEQKSDSAVNISASKYTFEKIYYLSCLFYLLLMFNVKYSPKIK